MVERRIDFLFSGAKMLVLGRVLLVDFPPLPSLKLGPVIFFKNHFVLGSGS